MKPVTSPPLPPLRWAGGKTRVREQIVRALAPHETYVEPFGGAAAVLLAKPRSPVEIYNDLDGELVNLFRVLQNDPEGFLEGFRWTLVARAEYERLAALDPEDLDPVERAHRFFYLVMGGWGAEAGRFRFQTSKKDESGGNRLIGALRTLEGRVRALHARLREVIIEQQPWEDILEQYDAPHTLFYLDPPYPGHQVRYGVGMRDLDQHLRLWEALRGLEGRWLLSTYDDPELHARMREVLGPEVHFARLPVHWGLQANTGGGFEALVSNYPFPEEFARAQAGAVALFSPEGATPGREND